MLDAVAHARLRGEMHDHIGLRSLRDRLKTLFVFEHCDVRRKAVRSPQQLVAPPLQFDVVVWSESIDPEYDMAIREEPFDEMKADEAGAAGNKEAHRTTRRDWVADRTA
jgi:hypothetical protein